MNRCTQLSLIGIILRRGGCKQSDPLFVCCDLGSVLPDDVWLIRKLILSNGLFGSAARACAPLCLCEWQLKLRQFPRGGNHLLCSHCRDSSRLYCFFLKLGIGTCRRIVYSLIFWHLFSLCVSSFQRPSLSLFLSASPPLLLRQHLTLDIQLLAGRSTVIPFRAAPFSSGLSQAIQITSSAAFRVAASAKCCFQTFLEGHHLIWSPRA